MSVKVFNSLFVRFHAPRYTGLVAASIKVQKDQFEAVIKALLSAPPMPATAIEGKRPRKGRREAAEGARLTSALPIPTKP